MDAAFPFDPMCMGKAIWCGQCRQAHASTRWTCPCERSWHTCRVHFTISTATPTSRKRRPAQVIVTHHSAMKRLDVIESPSASRLCLGPKLSARFGYLNSYPNQQSP
eukprot:9608132-Karenia_brevis.AAC.1